MSTISLLPNIRVTPDLHSTCRVLEHFGFAFLVFDVDGACVHASPEMKTLLESLPDRGPTQAQASYFARQFLRDEHRAGDRSNGHRSVGALSFQGASLHASRATLNGRPFAVLALRHMTSCGTAPSLTHWGLSRREEEVATRLAAGRNIKEVAALLGISRHTCRRHAEHIYAKLGIQCRAQLVLLVSRVTAPDLQTA